MYPIPADASLPNTAIFDQGQSPVISGNDFPAQQAVPANSEPLVVETKGSEGRILHHGHDDNITSSFFQEIGGPRVTTGTCLAFQDICFTVKTKDPATKAEVERKILKNCTGILRPGTLNAIMGASGGGKTSLLDVLADRKDAAGVSGTVLVNGKPRDKATFMHQSGYVVQVFTIHHLSNRCASNTRSDFFYFQDDVVMGTLTVRENLMFSANLRLPESISVEEKARRVEEVLISIQWTLCPHIDVTFSLVSGSIQVIEELGLGKVADSKVGNEMVRGVSGGERKRVNIGMELITSPRLPAKPLARARPSSRRPPRSMLFLDEPTTGLDASTSMNVLRILKRLSLVPL